MQISLPPEWEQFIAQELRGGHFHSADEVLCAALSRFKQDRKAAFPELPATRKELEIQLQESIDRFDRGESIDGEAMFKRLREQFQDAAE